MATVVLTVVYVLAGAFTAWSARERNPVLSFLLWPFLLPLQWFAGATPAFEGLGPSERAVVEAFVERIRQDERELAALEQTLKSAPPSVKPRLVTLRDALSTRIGDGTRLLDEIRAQLTLLRFSHVGDGEDERDGIEDLMAQLQAMTEV